MNREQEVLEKLAYQAKANIGSSLAGRIHASQAETCCAAEQAYQPSLRDRVQQQANSAASRAGEAARMQELANLLEKNPDVARILELMGEFHG